MSIKMKPSSLSDIRRQIDEADRVIVDLLGERWQLALAAVPFKMLETDFKDNSRRKRLLKERMEWAEHTGVPPDVVRQLYNGLIDLIELEQAKIAKALNE